MLERIIPHNVGAVILAAGKGTRFGCTYRPKVMLEIGNKPIVAYTIETLYRAGFTKSQICLVVGFKSGSVKSYFKNKVLYADQNEQIGTGHAAYVGMRALPKSIDNVLVLGGDDSAFYSTSTIQNFIKFHNNASATVSLISVEKDLPHDLGRVIKNDKGQLIAVKEKEEIAEHEKNIREVSTGTYCFDRAWYENAFLEMPIIEKLGEYGLNTSIKMARESDLGVEVFSIENNAEWFGINTKEEFEFAHNIKIKESSVN